jgi:myo-inositol-1(or 4)-monophosphatase
MSSVNASDRLLAAQVAEQAAYAAGTHLLASRSRLTAVLITHKDPADETTAIALEAEDLIRGVVSRHFPEHGFRGESGGARLRDGRPLWVVDPLDGRTNYQRGYPQYAVSIALVVDGEPVVGVVYDPFRNEFFGAIRGCGAVMNGARIRCAAPRSMLDALAATVFPRPPSTRMATYMAELGRVLRAFGGVRRSGSMALEMAYLAAGRIDAFWEHDTGSWDAAAGVLLLRESGAIVEARDAEPVLLSRSLLACTPGLRGSFLDLLSPA